MSVNAKKMSFLILMETASLAEPTKSSPTDSASAQLDISRTTVVSALSPAATDSSPSKEDAPSVLLTPSSRLKSTVAAVPMVNTRTTSESVKS